MIYRNYIAEDKEKIKSLCDEYGIDLPEKSMIYVAEDDNDEIVGFIGIKGELFIEPLISKNPVSAVKLYSEAMKFFRHSKVGKIRCICDSKHIQTFEKVGFKQIAKDKILMEKTIE